MPGPRHVRVCGPALASRLCPLSRQCPGQPSPWPAAPPRLTRLLLTPTGEHSLCVSSLPWDRDGGRGPRGGGLAPSEASSPGGLVGARTQNLQLSSLLNEDSCTPTPHQNSFLLKGYCRMPSVDLTGHLSKGFTKRDTETGALPTRCRYTIPPETFHPGNPETLCLSGYSRSSQPEMFL